MDNATLADSENNGREDFDRSPLGDYKYWDQEITSSTKRLNKWRKQADKIVKLYQGEETNDHTSGFFRKKFRINLFNSNVTTLLSMLYGNTPKVDVSRRFADSNDDVARVAGEILERMLNCDIEENGKEFENVLRSALFDRLVPGLGACRVRYDAQFEQITEMVKVETMAGLETHAQTREVLAHEDAPVDYYYWGDLLWGWSRNWAELPWIGYRNFLTKKQIKQRFPKANAEMLHYKKRNVNSDNETDTDSDQQSEWSETEVWEIWDRRTKKVYWWSKGYQKILDVKDDPLQLQGFFPSPPFLLANPTTSLYTPTPDYSVAQDLYREIDELSTRISIITDAVKVVGVYDANATGVQRMLKEGTENDLIPVDNWAMFSEGGGIKGSIDWLPIEEVVNCLEKLIALRSEYISLLQQTSGMSDIMRGGLDSQYEGTGQSALKAKFGSVRVQALQDQFAQFVSDALQLKADIIAKHFDAETIIQKSNMQYSYDRDLLAQAVDLIKNPQEVTYRVSVKPESVAMIDYAQLKQERVEYLNSLATFLQSSAPLMEMEPKAKPFLLELLKWGLSGFKGSNQIEGVIDKAIEAAMTEAQNPQEKPDPQQQAAQMQMQLEQMKQQGEVQKIQAKAQADQQVREQDRQADLQQTGFEHETKMAEIQAQSESKLAEIAAKLEADVVVETIQSQMNMNQNEQQVAGEMMKDQQEAELNYALQAQKAQDEIEKIGASAQAKIKETVVNTEAEKEKIRAGNNAESGPND